MIKFNEFQSSSTALPTDQIVGYTNTQFGGERRWTVDTLLAGAIKNVTGTAPISVATGTTTPVISIAAATTSAAGSMSSVDKTRLDGASSVNGLIKCNGFGTFSAAVAGTDYITATTFSGSNQLLGVNGYQKLPGGLLIQWMKSAIFTSQTTGILTFPISFPVQCLTAQVAWNMPVWTSAGAGDTFAQVINLTNSTITVGAQNATTASIQDGYILVLAIGY